MTDQLPSWANALRAQMEARPDGAFCSVQPEHAESLRTRLLEGFDAYPYGDEFQALGRARIARSLPIAMGPGRTPRLTQGEQPMLVLYDPEAPQRAFASLGDNLPPTLWPSAEPTLEGLLRDFAPYTTQPFESTHALPCRLRVVRETLDGMGMEDIGQLADALARVCFWLDGAATWASDSDDDPWPDAPEHASMISLRILAERARAHHPDRRPKITMRTLWSRSILTIEQGPWGYVIFEMRYQPAPFVAHLPAADGSPMLLPEDLPADLLACLLRGGSVTPMSLANLRAEELSPYVVAVTFLMEPGEATSFALLREMAAVPALRDAAVDLAVDLGATGLLYALAGESNDAQLTARLHDWMVPACPAQPETAEVPL